MSHQRLFLLGSSSHPFHSLLPTALPPEWQVCPITSFAPLMAEARPGDALLAFADHYPTTPVTFSKCEWEWLATSGLRTYVEFPASLPVAGAGTRSEATRLERAWFQPEFVLPNALGSISALVHMSYPAEKAWIRLGKLAGYDTLAFEAGDTPTHPLLFLHQPHLLVATTALSAYIAGRFAPRATWHQAWQAIIAWLLRHDSFSLPEVPAVCTASYEAPAQSSPLPKGAEVEAISRSLQWYHDAGMLLSSGQEPLYRSITEDGFHASPEWLGGDGSGGALEGFLSEFDHKGHQPTRCWRRADCVSETAGAFAAGSLLLGKNHGRTAQNLSDWLYHSSLLVSGDRANPDHPAYGLIGWHDRPRYGRFHQADGWNIYYGDDNARVLLGTILCSGALQSDRWLAPIIRNILANLRTSGPHGLRRNAIWNHDLAERGWESYRQSDELPAEWISPHYQCYLSACYLWLYHHTGDPMLLKHGTRGITLLMEAYPDRWRWTNGLQQERARMLLPLAWLLRVDDRPKHREWLHGMANDLLEHQVECGALREVLASGNGKYGPPQRHEDYGTREASLLQQDGDPVSDLLYTCNFAFLGLHEAAAVTNDPRLRSASDRLADYLVRIQSRSARPELSGAWLRTFDYQRWETWGSDADGAWGAWCVETGWTQSWITSVLAMRQLGTSLWEIYTPSGAAECYAKEKEQLLTSLTSLS